jgi:hypothetical protein
MPTAVRLPVLCLDLATLSSSSIWPSSAATSVGTGEVGGGISVGTGASVGDETSRRNGLRGTGGAGGTGGGALEDLDFASLAACT